MAAEVSANNRGKEEDLVVRLQRECDHLRRKYAGLEAVYEQNLRRLERAEASKSEFEQQRTTELMNIAGRIREKIQSLEMKQLRNGEDFDDFKQQLKHDLSRQYQDALEELITDLDRQRRLYSDLCLQHSILKAEYDTTQKMVTDNEEKFRLKFSNQSTQFDAEREALQARIEHLSTELANTIAMAAAAKAENGGNTDGEAMKNLQSQANDWRQRYDRLETELRKFQTAKERETDELKQALEEAEDEKQAALNQLLRRSDAELGQEQKKREFSDERYARAHRDLLALREENESLQRRFDFQTDELNIQFIEKRSQFEKEREANLVTIEELTKQVTTLKDQSTKFETLYRQGEIQMNQMEQKFKRESEKERDNWRNEKLTLEARIRELEHQIHDADRTNREHLQDTQLALKRTLWEKEKLADDLAKISLADANKRSLESTGHSESTFTDHHDFYKFSRRLLEQEQRFSDLSSEFDRYRQKHDQFRDVLHLVNDQIEKTTNMEDGADVQGLIDDLKGKVNQLLTTGAPSRDRKAEQTGKESKSSGKKKVTVRGDRTAAD